MCALAGCCICQHSKPWQTCIGALAQEAVLTQLRLHYNLSSPYQLGLGEELVLYAVKVTGAQRLRVIDISRLPTKIVKPGDNTWRLKNCSVWRNRTLYLLASIERVGQEGAPA